MQLGGAQRLVVGGDGERGRLNKGLQRAEAALRDYALTFPEAVARQMVPGVLDNVQVRRRVFLYLSHVDRSFHVSALLPESGGVMLSLGFTTETAFGLGERGWVTGMFAPGEEVPVDMLELWIDESYRAVAPKKLIAQLDAAAS